jgi:outer membrane protein OmpA-like peptidoglycan-associated protein
VLPNTKVSLLDEKGAVVFQTMTDKDGNYRFDIEPGKTYKLQFTQPGHEEKNIEATSIDVKGHMVINAQLEKKPDFGILCRITDAADNSPLDEVQVSVKDRSSGKLLINTTTSSNGEVQTGLESVKVGDVLTLDVSLTKSGYLTKTQTIQVTIKSPGLINLHELMDVSIGKIDVGIDLASLIDIKPIYFDLGKYTIRKDASIELDKIVKIMNEYPSMEIELGSHTDCRGSVASNATLSDNRAKASAEYIKKRISNPGRINGKGYGESKLKIDCPCEGTVKSTCSEDEHQQNRRTEFIIMKM